MKISAKVAFNIASEASYVYILNGQKFIKNAKIWQDFEAYGQTVLPDKSILIFFARCLKITEKVSFNIASEASYAYILSGQKFIKKKSQKWFWKPEAYGQTVLPDR